MSKYAQAAVKAVELFHSKAVNSPVEAWNKATIELFGANSWGHKKGCPRNAFLGLCEEGLIKQVPPRKYISRENSKNKKYAVQAVSLLNQDSKLVNDINILWEIVISESGLSHNYQMDVVCSLWKNSYIFIEGNCHKHILTHRRSMC